MSEPSKQEQAQIDSAHRQLMRLANTLDALERRMSINGRSGIYGRAAGETKHIVKTAEERIQKVISK